MLCIRCGGTGKYLGNGMIQADCYCKDVVIHTDYKPAVCPNIDKRSKDYRESIKKIMVETGVDRIEAVKLFEQAYK